MNTVPAFFLAKKISSVSYVSKVIDVRSTFFVERSTLPVGIMDRRLVRHERVDESLEDFEGGKQWRYTLVGPPVDFMA